MMHLPKRNVVWLVLLTLGVSACGPNAGDLAATYVAETLAAATATYTQTPTATALPVLTDTPAPVVSPIEAPTVEPSPAPTIEPVAVVGPDIVNLRAGPGTKYEQIGGAAPGERLEVLGQLDNCTWIKVRLQGVGESWVSGNVVSLNVPCEQLVQIVLPTPDLAQITPNVDPSGAQPVSPGDHIIRVNNKTGQDVLLYLEGPGTYFFTIPPGNGQQISILPGVYEVTYVACGSTVSAVNTLNVNWLFDFKCP